MTSQDVTVTAFRAGSRFIAIGILGGICGAIGVPFAMKIWHVDFDQASTAIAVGVAVSIAVLRGFILLVDLIPTPATDQSHEIRPMTVRMKVVIGIIVAGVIATLATVVLLLSWASFVALGLSWAATVCQAAFMFSATLLLSCLVAVPSLVAYWVVAHEVEGHRAFAIKFGQLALASHLLIAGCVSDSRVNVITPTIINHVHHRAA